MSGAKNVQVKITSVHYATVHPGYIFFDEQCEKRFGKLTNIKNDKASLLLEPSDDSTQQKQILLYSRECCTIEGDDSDLPCAILLTKLSDYWNLEFCTRNAQEYYENCFKKDPEKQDRETKLKKLGYTFTLKDIGTPFSEDPHGSKKLFRVELQTNPPFIWEQNFQSQLFKNMTDALDKGTIFDPMICEHKDGCLYVQDNTYL